MTVIPILKKEYVTKLAEEGKRVDGRAFDQFREISIETNCVNKAEGSARVKIGNTQVIVGIKMDLGEPYPDTPNSGVLSTAAELIPLASPDFEAGPPQRNAIELARVVDRGVRESQVVQLDKLVVIPGEKVWINFIDIHILDYDGNLFDAASLAALAALGTTTVPVKRFEAELPEEFKAQHPENYKLPMTEPPISCTAVKISNFVFFDPSLDEEELADARLTVATDHKGDIRAMQKGLAGSFTKDEIQSVIQGALENGRKIREKLSNSIR